MQKSRVNWLKLRDKNTKIFHTTTLIRRRNKIEAWVDGNDEWVYDQTKLKEMAVNFFSDLLSSDPHASGKFVKGSFPDLSQESISWLEREYIDEEISQALKKMSPYKPRSRWV